MKRTPINYILLIFLLCDYYANCLNNFIDNYETLNYKSAHVASQVSRRKRSIGTDSSIYAEPINFRFNAYNRSFHVLLHPIDESVGLFHGEHYADVNGEFADIKPSHFLYEGYLKDDPASNVHGSVFDGVFEGHIQAGDGHRFTIDKAAKYFENDERPTNYHSIIYKDDEINHRKWRVKRDAEELAEQGCGLNSRVRREMTDVQNSGERQADFFTNYMTMKGRSKRSTKDAEGVYSVRTCSLYMQADHKLYEHIRMKEGNNDPIRTREEIVSLFYNHIKAVNEIYESTNFNGIKGLHFVIQRTSIYTPDTCDRGRAKSDSDNPFCEENVNVSNFLNLNSQRNHSAFSLAYALTFRDFVGGTLGLAWVASLQFNTAGGICQVHQRYNEGSRGWVYRSLNTGIVTLVNYGNRVPARVSQLTLAHEIRHNFGSPHDFPAECQPGLPDGNFIMFASATSGDKPNNGKFSPCSIKNISSVLHVVLKSMPVDPTRNANPVGYGKRNCFQERTSAFCGNQIFEPGEECDCGFSQADCDQMGDKCCVPHEGRGFGGPGPCKRKRGAQCSPSQGYCCNSDNCSLHTKYEEKICRQESECSHHQTCDGRSAQCPQSPPKFDGLPCQDSTKVCSAGSCNGSVCELFGLKDCFLTEGKPDELCFLACIKDGKCTSSIHLPEFATNRSTFLQSGRKGKPGLILHPGSPCNNYKGYCDIFRKCRSVDANGPLARLKNLLFDKRTIETLTSWAQDNWWMVMLIGMGFLIVMALFVKCCAVHTPSTNPNKPAALNFYQTLTRPGTLIRQHRQRHRAAAGSAGVQLPTSSGAANGSRPSAMDFIAIVRSFINDIGTLPESIREDREYIDARNKIGEIYEKRWDELHIWKQSNMEILEKEAKAKIESKKREKEYYCSKLEELETLKRECSNAKQLKKTEYLEKLEEIEIIKEKLKSFEIKESDEPTKPLLDHLILNKCERYATVILYAGYSPKVLHQISEGILHLGGIELETRRFKFEGQTIEVFDFEGLKNCRVLLFLDTKKKILKNGVGYWNNNIAEIATYLKVPLLFASQDDSKFVENILEGNHLENPFFEKYP